MHRFPSKKLGISLFLFLSLSLFSSVLSAQNDANWTVSGRVIDAKTGETIIGANIIPVGEPRGVSTNGYGQFSITLAEKAYVFNVSFIGYKTFTFELD